MDPFVAKKSFLARSTRGQLGGPLVIAFEGMREHASACRHSCQLQRYGPERRPHDDAGHSVVRFP
jgi:hypothetical protein